MRTTFKATIITTLLSLIVALPAWAASTKEEVLSLKEEVSALKDGQAEMQKELAEIKKLLEAGAKAPARAAEKRKFEPKDISITGAPFKGQPDAKVTLVEYSDYQCPFCSRHSRNTMPELQKNYIDTGKVKFVMREFPLTSLHPRAVAASLAALCARDQGKYWEMHDVLFANQRKMTDDDIKSYSEQAGLDTETFVVCMDQGKYNAQVKSDLAEGRSMGITGTPSFAVGLTDPNDPDKAKIMKVFSGAVSIDVFTAEIDKLLGTDDGATASP